MTTSRADNLPTPQVMAAFEAAPGFMPTDEGLALYAAAVEVAPLGPLIEIGSYCGRSTLLLAAAAATAGTHVVTIDHHRGSEEHQPGWEYHDPSLVDPAVGRIDTLPVFRRTIATSGLEPHVIAITARSEDVGRYWAYAAGLVFVDGSHTDESAQRDYAAWAEHVVHGGLLAIHDVFADPAEGGQAPWRIYQRALAGGEFTEEPGCRSLRLLRRVARGD
jgi:MMP 1-O-methyltransferase